MNSLHQPVKFVHKRETEQARTHQCDRNKDREQPAGRCLNNGWRPVVMTLTSRIVYPELDELVAIENK